jgi:hypothetical protein
MIRVNFDLTLGDILMLGLGDLLMQHPVRPGDFDAESAVAVGPGKTHRKS